MTETARDIMHRDELEQLSMTFNNCKIKSFPELDEKFRVKVEELNWRGSESPTQLIKFIDFSSIQFVELDEYSHAEFLRHYGEKLPNLE